MKAFLDGTASFLAALATLAICGLPSWFTYKAIEANVAPWWAWFAVAALCGVGILMTFAFLRKAAGGIAPSRERKRR
ncbi:hypothetical protein SAMN05444287_1722 [Octadecabacter temperatus]|uniref:Uncharacterized protein n=1 Tax=Octadecabacter temperatus TaxID=1458307 RepID=A0A0K0Y6R1_9RHOB|nr:hypothetical protein [Octadecabacter temperatus]AKS46605.1 hypothetical protein OSB_20660 [Octadecabacter temperatus]SIO17585.1 hypothetical protein SAMN05444287_1722 [Octadecabacter temperatus]